MQTFLYMLKHRSLLVYRKYSTRGGIKLQCQVLYLPQDSTPSAVFFPYIKVNGALANLLRKCWTLSAMLLGKLVLLVKSHDAF